MGTLEPSLLGSTPHLLDSSSMVLRRTGFFFFKLSFESYQQTGR